MSGVRWYCLECKQPEFVNFAGVCSRCRAKLHPSGAADALKALQELTGSDNRENPWLGVTASVGLLQIEIGEKNTRIAELERSVAQLDYCNRMGGAESVHLKFELKDAQSRIAELEAENARLKRNWEVLLSSFRMHSPKMNGEHCWEFRRMHSLRGSSLEEALRRYFKQEFDYDLQQLEQPEAKPE